MHNLGYGPQIPSLLLLPGEAEPRAQCLESAQSMPLEQHTRAAMLFAKPVLWRAEFRALQMTKVSSEIDVPGLLLETKQEQGK